METEKHWTLDRRVPLALVISILVQTSAGVWWASNISAQVANNVIRINSESTRIERIRDETRQIDRTMVRLITQIENLGVATGELKAAQVETNTILRKMFQEGQ